jgi:hypothetical protein
MITRTFSFDKETIAMLEKQSEKMHLSRSAYLRLLLLQQNKKMIAVEDINE